MRLLRVFSGMRRPLSLGEAASAAGMTASNTHRYLVSFIRSDLVIQDPRSGLYDLGPFALNLGLSAMARLDEVEIGTQALFELQSNVDMSAFLSIWTERGPTMIRWLDGSRPIRVNVKPGSIAPLLTSASGRAFLAYRGDEKRSLIESELRQRRKAKATTFTSMSDVRQLLNQVRRTGLGWVHGERAPGVFGLSAPILDMYGQAVLSLTVVELEGLFDADFDGEVANILRRVGKAASERLGYQAGGVDEPRPTQKDTARKSKT